MEKGVPIRSISRAIAVLQAVNRHGSLTLMQISREAGVPYPTACRIVQTMVHEGLIEQEPARKHYRATALVQTLSHGFQNPNRLVQAARPHIIGLTRQVGWPISITTPVGHNMMIRDSTHTLTSLTFNNVYPGYTLPMLESSAGRCYLAFMPDEEREAILKGLRDMSGAQTSVTDTLSMFESGLFVEEIRAQGYATKGRVRYTENPGKTSSITVPLFDEERVVGGMTLIFFASAKKMTDAVKMFVPELQATASAIHQTMVGSDASRAQSRQGAGWAPEVHA